MKEEEEKEKKKKKRKENKTKRRRCLHSLKTGSVFGPLFNTAQLLITLP